MSVPGERKGPVRSMETDKSSRQPVGPLPPEPGSASGHPGSHYLRWWLLAAAAAVAVPAAFMSGAGWYLADRLHDEGLASVHRPSALDLLVAALPAGRVRLTGPNGDAGGWKS